MNKKKARLANKIDKVSLPSRLLMVFAQQNSISLSSTLSGLNSGSRSRPTSV